MERRKFVVGLGALASGSAAAMGTGAFTSVEADRTLSVDVEGDADAFLSITKAEEDGTVTPNAEDYVDVGTDGVVSIDLSETEANGSGVNRNAKTVFDNLLDITNQGTQEIEVWAESDLIASEGGYLGIYAENAQDGDGNNNGFSESDPATIPVGESETNIGIYIPKGTDFDEISDGTLTFVAQRTGGNRD